MMVKNRRLSDVEFFQERKAILATWPTGSEVDLEEALTFHKSLLAKKNFALRLVEAREKGETLIRCESGVPTVEEFSSYLRFLQDEGHADLLGAHIDSMTRNQRYQEAARGLEESLKTGRWVLNGFPIIAHGVQGTRKLIDAVDLPVMLRNPSVDQRLAAEIGFASGLTGSSGCPTLAFSQYTRNIPVEVVIRHYQYVYRLMGCYTEREVPMVASIIGGFAILSPLSVLVAGAIIDALIAAEQGVKHVNLCINAQGNLVQDVAAIVVLRKTAKRYLEAQGYKDVEVTMNLSNWSGQFPADTFDACAIISSGIIAAVASKSELCTVKTIEEAKSIPTRVASANSLRLGKTLIKQLKSQNFQLDDRILETETVMMEKETELIVDKILELGDGDAVVGQILATEKGVFDVPFATSQYVQCRVKGVRDLQGAVRYLDHGNLPFTREIIDFHKEKIAEREKATGNKLDYQTIVKDLTSIARGEL